MSRYMEHENLSVNQLWDRLRRGGCPIGLQAMRNWLADDELIAPLAYHRDLSIIAKVTSDDELRAQLEPCINAIRQVRGAHLRASHHLASRIMARVVDALREGRRDESSLEIEEDVVLVRLEHIDEESIGVRASIVNRLLDGQRAGA